ncbi:uncharacterized protein LOC62_03G003762 [Vanrija pseudolonga]|uniref:Uncharacterized protein n=1 Tax=Vanrija pseudolonga TaxID=143232 RepID=A0AAF0Y9J6_9TREE|nr:hypothetical protein LOC62_03G003762 [Vanrija pseudolonga]
MLVLVLGVFALVATALAIPVDPALGPLTSKCKLHAGCLITLGLACALLKAYTALKAAQRTIAQLRDDLALAKNTGAAAIAEKLWTDGYEVTLTHTTLYVRRRDGSRRPRLEDVEVVDTAFRNADWHGDADDADDDADYIYFDSDASDDDDDVRYGPNGYCA